ncbi:hypothetical protein GKE82_09780 [Conexibacter sp. W3-3-2]|uniref:hypothetical protein n=1 Tax=Conexibacter sp. W3-3-2 TaxID=2675227 RepID=UPI0012B760C4|nr:hypothetical protein [Conexibacter sp. W3-3-2]MTD44571.1 hypothetical protein [Conexibacter sp. W3-3-2]
MLSLSPVQPLPLEHRETLAETAAQAAGGGTVVGLVQLADGRTWHATVVTADGIVDVRLDPTVRSAVVVPRPGEVSGHRDAA